MKVCFYCAILLFRLYVGLRLERGKESSFDTKEVTKQRLKLRQKNRSLLTYDEVREAVMLYHHVYNYFC